MKKILWFLIFTLWAGTAFAGGSRPQTEGVARDPDLVLLKRYLASKQVVDQAAKAVDQPFKSDFNPEKVRAAREANRETLKKIPSSQGSGSEEKKIKTLRNALLLQTKALSQLIRYYKTIGTGAPIGTFQESGLTRSTVRAARFKERFQKRAMQADEKFKKVSSYFAGRFEEKLSAEELRLLGV